MTKPKLHHVGIVFPSEEDALSMMDLLGLQEQSRGTVDLWSVLCIFTKGNGATPIEFVIPDGGPLAKFNKGAGGLHHVAVEVDSLDRVREDLSAKGMRLLQDEHVRGAGPFLCNFLNPMHTRGVTVEYIEVLPVEDP